MADRLVEKTYQTELDDGDKALIESLSMFFLATADGEGEPSCTFRGGDPGFVKVVDSKTLFWPEYDGNGMFLALGNLLVNPQVHLLFVDFEKQTRFRVAGRAEIIDGPLVEASFGAKTGVLLHVTKAFPNCKRYIPRMALVERARHVPRLEEVTPVADWKRHDWACDALPANDRALDPALPE